MALCLSSEAVISGLVRLYGMASAVADIVVNVRYPELALTIVIAVQFWLVAAQQTRPTFRSRVDLVALSVSVVDARQRFVTDLQSRDFEVFENGVRRDVTLFGAAGVPADILLLLDISSSMQSSRAIVACSN
jgi:hypothetical protein